MMNQDGKCVCCKSVKSQEKCENKAKFGPYCGIHKSGKFKLYHSLTIDVASASSVARSSSDASQSRESKINMRYSLNQLTMDVIKSGLQKSIRRGNCDTAFSYAIEGDFFSLGEKLGVAKGNRTNLMNRLRIISVEDLCDLDVICQILPWFNSWTKLRAEDTSRQYLLNIVNVLCRSKKIRLVSDLKVFLFREEHRSILGDKFDVIFNGWNKYDTDKKDPSPYERFTYLLNQHNPNCLYWYDILNKSGHDGVVWTHLLKVNPKLVCLQQLQSQLTKNHKESYLFTVIAIAMCLFDDMIANSSAIDESHLYTKEETDEIYGHHYEHWTQDNLPYKTAGWLPADIVVDMHTNKGRSTGKNATDFADVGSFVNNENIQLLFPLLRHIYNLKKKIQPNPSLVVQPLDIKIPTKPWTRECLMFIENKQPTIDKKPTIDKQPVIQNHPLTYVFPESKEITEINLFADSQGPIYGQRVTASWKPLTYLTENWVYKGPYTGKREHIPSNTVERYHKFLSYGDTSVLPMEEVFGPNRSRYLRSPNIGTQWPPKTEVDTVISGVIGRILSKDDTKSVSSKSSMGVYTGVGLIDNGGMDWIKMLYHFIIRFIIGAGDAGLFNYLNNYGLDYEENRTSNGGDPKCIIDVLFGKSPDARIRGLTERSIKENALILIDRLTRDVLLFASGQELSRTQLVLGLFQ